jgi:hypothetical protein
MDTISRGNAAEGAVLASLVRAGIAVFTPFGGGTAFDLVAVTPPDGDLVRVQVKSGRVRQGCVSFNACSTDHGNGRQPYTGRADAIAVDVPEVDEVFVVPVDDCPSFVGRLRLTPTRNNQKRGIRFAADYTLASWIHSLTSRIPGRDEQVAPVEQGEVDGGGQLFDITGRELEG